MYKCIVADPPWNETGGGKIKRGADRHYPLLKTPQIIEVMKNAEVWLPDESCHLWLWVTNNHLPDGLKVMEALGFRYVTNLCWAKDRFGIGQYLRGQHELCLFGVRGKTMMPEKRNVPSLVQVPRGEHSVKPNEAFGYIERVSPGPRLEMFSRGTREGWTTWGNE